MFFCYLDEFDFIITLKNRRYQITIKYQLTVMLTVVSAQTKAREPSADLLKLI